MHSTDLRYFASPWLRGMASGKSIYKKYGFFRVLLKPSCLCSNTLPFVVSDVDNRNTSNPKVQA